MRYVGFVVWMVWASAGWGATIVVPTGVDAVANGVALQAALNGAACGDVVVVQAGAVYQGPGSADQAFLLPNRGGCSEFITIQTSNVAGLPAAGVRVNPAVHAGAMARLVADTSQMGMPVITPAINANHYRLIGLDITNNGVKYGPNLVNIRIARGGSSESPTYAEMLGTHDFIIDRCFIHPAEVTAADLFPSIDTRTAGRGVNAEGVDVSVINSYIAGFAGKFPPGSSEAGGLIDSYGVYTVTGPGPLHVVNNYIEAQFNNVFTGGGDNYTLNSAVVSNPTLTSAMLTNVGNLHVGDLVAFSSANAMPKPWETGRITAITGNDVSFTLIQPNGASTLTPPDAGGTARWNGINVHGVEIRGNTLNKPDSWNAFSQPKAFIELKDCVDCIIDGNQMYSGVGTTVAFTPRNQNGSAPWARIENLTYTNNVMVGYKWAVGSQGSDNEQPSVSSGNWAIRNNLWYGALPVPGSADLFLQLSSGLVNGHDIVVTHNTILQPANILAATGVTNGFVFKDNIVNNGEYGVQCYLAPADLTACFPGFTMTGNVIVGAPMSERPYCTNLGSAVYPPGNTCVTDSSLVGFVDLAANNYRLAPGSPFKGTASDGKDPGVDMDALGGITPPPPPVDTTPPVVTLVAAPAGGTTFALTANATDNVGVVRVEFYFDGKLIAMQTTEPYMTGIKVTGNPNTVHRAVANAYDAAGNVGTVSVMVKR